jgi:HD-GYP domain-containing protein (c-di-GMP phosphodiesterase class II)
LRTIDATINSNTSLNTTLSIILDHVRIQLGVDAADILLHNPQTMMFEFAEGKGFRTKDVQKSALYIGKGHLGRAIFENRTIFSNKLAEDSEFARRGLITSEQFVAHCVSPLVSKGKIKGVLEVFHRSPLEENREWITFLEMLANEAAIAIDNIQMFQELQQSNLELVMAYDATIDSLAQALDLRDAETGGHSRHVVDLTLKLARSLGIQGGALAHIRRGSMLHDIGKMGVPDILLRKPGPLTEEEWVIMRQHPILAHTLMSRIPYLRQALDIPYCHHEKWDGSGYPRGLKGEEIPLAARIFAAADVYDVMTSDRPYRKALTEQEALDYIRSQAGKHFDPKVAQAFLGMFESETD